MKQILFALIILSIYCPESWAQCSGNIVLNSQQDVNNFPLMDCSSVTGSLEITGSNITNLDSLYMLTSVNDFRIENVFFGDLSGLENLTSVGSLEIKNTDNLFSLSGLDNLTTISDHVEIVRCGALNNLSGLGSLSSIGDYFVIYENASLDNLEGIENLESIEGRLSIELNNQLLNLEGLEGLTEISNNLIIVENESLNNLSGLDNLQWVEGEIRIEENPALISLEGLESLDYCNNRILIDNNESLETLTGLSALNIVGGDFRIFNNNSLVNLTGLSTLFTVMGDFRISHNASLESLAGIENSFSVQEDFILVANTQLTSLFDFEGSVAFDRLDIDSNVNLINLSGLESLSELDGGLRISENPKLESLEGLNNIETLGSLSLSYNDTLSSLAALGNLTSINGNATIFRNYDLIDLTGLEALTEVTGDLKLWYNVDLISLAGLENLTTVGGEVEITGQTSIENLNLNSLGSVGETLFIENNPALNSLESLESLTSLGGLNLAHLGINSLAGLENLTSITEGLTLFNNDSLTSLDSLYNLTEVGGVITIEGNESLADLNGLEGLTSISKIELINNPNFTSLVGLNNLESADLGLTINNNNQLTSLLGIENLTSVGTLSIEENNGLESLSGLGGLINCNQLRVKSNLILTDLVGLEQLSTIESTLYIADNPQLENLEGLEQLSDVHSFYIENNNAFTSFQGLEQLNNIGGFTSINENDILSNFAGLEGITQIEESLFIENNNSLVDLSGLENLTTIGGSLEIRENGVLTTLEGLNSLEAIEGFRLFLEDNWQLESLEALGQLASIDGWLRIEGSNSLASLMGFESLADIGSLKVTNNYSLTEIANFPSLSDISGSVTVTDNQNLESCCNLLYFLNFISEEDFTLSNNAISCNDIGVIQTQCGTILQVQTFFDENENGLLDGSEEGLAEQSFSLNNLPVSFFSNEEGLVDFYLNTVGDYSINYNPSALWTLNDVSPTIDIEVSNDTIIYLPLIPVSNFTIQRVDLTSSITRCNQETNYWLSYTNQGTSITDGVVELIPSDIANFVSANPPVDSTADGKLYWFYENLYPTHSKQILLIYEMPGVEQIGQIIEFETSMETNTGLGDAKSLLSSPIICAYDPNDKLNSPSGYGNENYTLFGDTLEYTIRFQNTGNDTAFTIIIEDELSEHLNLNTFRPIASSHNVETQIDIETRLATFTFNDIYLPDSFVNEVASHGFVKYQILGTGNLDENTDVQNTASIFFDENPAIITNTTNNRMVSELPNLPFVAASPIDLNFGEIALDELAYTLPQTLLIENPGDLPLYIESFNFQNDVFNSGDIQGMTIEGGGSQEVLIYFEPNEAGTYQSQLILESNVGNLPIALNGTAITTTGVETIVQANFFLYPNPNKGLFTVQSESETIEFLRIQNSLGEIILEEQGVNNFTQIDLTKQSKGLYFISLKTAEGFFVEKIIIQ